MSWLAIDFGTSESSAAFVNNNGEPKSIRFTSPNKVTQYDFPTTAWVNDRGEILVGYDANASASRNPANYIFEFKLELDDSRDNLKGGVSYTDIIKAILQEIKKEAENERNGNMSFVNAIITVPVDFGEIAIAKIKNAAVNTGFEEVKIVTEPQAAAIYFNRIAATIQEEREFTSLIYDMGCGTFDPAIISIKNNSMGADYSLPINGAGTKMAGKYFDRLIQSHFEDIHPIPNDSNRAQINRELKKKCKEEIKCILSGKEIASTEVIYGAEGTKTFSLDKTTFNSMIEHAIKESISKCQKLCDDNQLNWKNIDAIFFVGGSCNIPYVRTCVETYIKKYNKDIQVVWDKFKETELEPQYAVSLGAALYIRHLNDINERIQQKEAEEKLIEERKMEEAEKSSLAINMNAQTESATKVTEINSRLAKIREQYNNK